MQIIRRKYSDYPNEFPLKKSYCFFIFSPYIIGTMNQGVSSSPNLEMHHNFRYIHSVFTVAMFAQLPASKPSSLTNIYLVSHQSISVSVSLLYWWVSEWCWGMVKKNKIVSGTSSKLLKIIAFLHFICLRQCLEFLLKPEMTVLKQWAVMRFIGVVFYLLTNETPWCYFYLYV